ncbi:MAG TPA: glycerol-3-phosphate acyltransferase [Acidimicrobiia bacterium]|nr:glycerol-3-phosphate acyltransferase [Acidimicrobiia bacterium]
MTDTLSVAAAVAAGYLLGTFPTAVLASKVATRGRVDIRTAGSGNPGGLNAAHVLGRKWGAVVMFIDAAKGFGAGLLGWWIGGPDGAYLGATAAIAGHIWPVWTRFHGGKGVATSGGAVLAVFPAFFPIDAGVAAVGALRLRNAERAIHLSSTVWVLAAFAWWLGDLPNLWGPDPTLMLPISQTVGAGLILFRFYEARRDAP